MAQNAPERPDLKTKLLAEIDAAVRSDVVIASSSSGIPSSKFISQCQHPERVLIGHPFNPPHLMPLVEVVPHSNTSASAISNAMAFYESVGRRPVHIKEEVPGFVANRLQAALCNEAYSLVARGIVTAQDLDACVTTSLGPRWAMVGPFLANAMGGGGGSEGFKHLLEHLGPASRVWVEDMQEHKFDWSQDSIDALGSSVSDELQGKDVQELEQKRDDDLVKFFKIKGVRRTSFHDFLDHLCEAEEHRVQLLWTKLLKNITDGVGKGLAELEEADKKPDAVKKARDWFRLDARSLPTTLNGLTLEDLRQVYREGSGGQPMRGLQRNNWGTTIFLLADAQVLQDPDLNLLKVADAKYDPVAAVPKNSRVGPQRYFGWFTIPPTAVLDFYNEMDIFTFEQISNHALPGTHWDVGCK
ncbi:uncharacterized protein J4E88_010568 [Alternaria novae-zelandiae]|uniref:uncharacterized protein n=1 Tax=Alternaria novae-zelandiae TaxID=430562 RepID=UPI0020C3C0ED|nr:uncharacterized protein J4E88_010568 [Alternaria novae-zelandiae]KAI4665243.1 hypothetical protein J4E88_010568 [Alternaria novae-zelandiae]